MITIISWYLLKVLIVSGVLCGYYFLALKDKIFHKWNRFYLLFSVALSILLPLISINIFNPSGGQGSVIKVLQTITVQDEIVIELGKSSPYSSSILIACGYILVSLFLIATLIFTLFRINRLRKNNQQTEVNGIKFFNTNDDGTPFSFFNSIFWNRKIDLNSISGQQILDHEIAHIREKHTYDKLFINVVLLFFWINPFFWLIRKELNMIHEFIADKIAIEDEDVSAFAEMILASVYPQKQFYITNHFFYSPIKRRLKMLSKNKNSTINYASRLLALPLAAIVFFAFSLKMKKTENVPIYIGEALTVIIDAGHGGTDPGAKEGNYNEKDFALAIAKDVKRLNENKNINIILTRNSDQTISGKDRVQFANENNADLFISIHLDAIMKKHVEPKGLNIIIPKDNNNYLSESKLLGSSVMAAFKNNYTLPTSPELIQWPNNIYILKENKYPAIIVQAACISAEKDLAYIGKAENQKIVAENILKGIENYVQNNLTALNNNSAAVSDTIPAMSYKGKKVTGLKVVTATGMVVVNYKDGSTETITKTEANDRGFVLPPQPPSRNPKNMPPPPPPAPLPPPPPQHVDSYNGKKIKSIDRKINNGKESFLIHYKDGTQERISSDEAVKAGLIYSAPRVIKDEEVIIPKVEPGDIKKVTGSKSSDGLNQNMVFTRTEQEAQFPGGLSQWTKYISGVINKNIDAIDKEGKYGTVTLKFIVDVNGNVSDVEATTMKESQLAKVAIEAIRKGPKWIPAMQNGHVVNAYRLQPVTLVDGKASKSESITLKEVSQEDTKKVFLKLEQEAQFPGGVSAWTKYITMEISKNIDKIAKEGKYGTASIKFIVDENGNVSDVEATTLKGTELAKIAIDAIRKGPKWIPGKQNGHVVNSYKIQPVTLKEGS